MAPRVEFCGERFDVIDRSLVIGREGDVVVDDNPYLHRRFLQVEQVGQLWCLTNIGARLSATVADADGRLQAYLAPGGRLPLVFDRTVVWFVAGPTTYELEILLDRPAFSPAAGRDEAGDAVIMGATTVGRVTLTPDQRMLVLALTESVLRRRGPSPATLPTNADAALRLGWSPTKFNRKLDNVCEKLAAAGVRGLHGGPGRLASNRRARLIEYALATRLVTADDLGLLDQVLLDQAQIDQAQPLGQVRR